MFCVKNHTNLTQLGEWLHVYGEAIYGTRKWKISHEGKTNVNMLGTGHRRKHGFHITFGLDDVWFTKKDQSIYCISLYSSKVNKMEIQSIKDIDIKK